MKGTFFQKPLELNLLVEGESWHQGDVIAGVLTAKNHGSEAVDASELVVYFAHGQLKKVHDRKPGALKTLAAARGSGTLAPGASLEIPWKFETDRNVPITDTSSSLYLAYGRGTALEQLGQLQVTMKPYWIIQEVLNRLTTEFRFVVKTQKATKAGLDVKLAPPTSKGFASLEFLFLTFNFEGDNLKLEYSFQMKKVEATAASMALKKENVELEQTLAPTDYKLPSGRPNHEAIEASLKDALSRVEAKVLF